VLHSLHVDTHSREDHRVTPPLYLSLFLAFANRSTPPIKGVHRLIGRSMPSQFHRKPILEEKPNDPVKSVDDVENLSEDEGKSHRSS
jgi:hypothetical protein